MGPRPACRDHARDRSVDRAEDQGREALADRASFRPLVDAVRRGDERAHATRRRRETPSRAATTGVEITYVAPSPRYTVPKADARLTPYVSWRKFPDGRTTATVHLPLCCFPAYRGDGKPSRVKVLKPDHPIVRGVPAEFEIAQTEMYDEPFHVPEPDEVILEERWASGEWFRSGAIWKLGKGRVFYFRPGHETYSVFTQGAAALDPDQRRALAGVGVREERRAVTRSRASRPDPSRDRGRKMGLRPPIANPCSVSWSINHRSIRHDPIKGQRPPGWRSCLATRRSRAVFSGIF